MDANLLCFPGGVKGFDLNGNRSGNTVYNSLAFSNAINYSFPS